MKYLKVFTNFMLDMEPLSFDERGRLFTAMLMYAENGAEPGLIGNERFLWGTAKKQIDAQSDSYKKLCDMNKRNRAKRDEPLPSVTDRDELLLTDTKSYGPLQEKEKEQEQDKETLSIESVKKEAPCFRPPTEEEVRQYVEEKHFQVDPGRFCAHYSANGWKVGKAPMKDWKAAVRYWEVADREKHPKSAYRNADLEKLEVQL